MLRCLILLLVATVALGDVPTLYQEEERVAGEVHEHGKGHLKHVAPPPDHDHHHTNVTVNFYIRNIFSIGERNHIWKVQLTFREEWLDTRLKYTAIDDMKYLPYGNPDDIWTPDLFFHEEVSSQDPTRFHSHDLLRIYPDGHVSMSRRVSMDLYCPADFHQKSFVCKVRVASYMYTKEEMDLFWKAEDPIQYREKIFIPGYVLNNVTTTKCDTHTLLGDFSCLEADFSFSHTKCEEE